MAHELEVQYISDPRQLPALFLLMPDNWQGVLERMQKMGRLTNVALGGVFIYEKKLGDKTWRIIGVEICNEVDGCE
jgi:hypothetical protein